MLLGLSSKKNGLETNYELVKGTAHVAGSIANRVCDSAMDSTDETTGAVAHAELLVGLADAIYAREPDALATKKSELVSAAGRDVLVDATAVVSNFFMMTRIADGTGTPLDASTTEMSEEVREAVGVNELVSRR